LDYFISFLLLFLGLLTTALAAQEYPLVSNIEIQQLLQHYNGHNFVEIWCSYNDAPKYKKNRIDYQWFHGKRLSSSTKNGIIAADKPKLNYFFGSFYVILHYKFLFSLFLNPDMLNVLTYLRYARVPDEVFFATAIMNSKEFKCTHFNSNLRYVNWGRENAFNPIKCVHTKKMTDIVYGKKYLKGGSHPCILGMQDVKQLTSDRQNRRDEKKTGKISPPFYLFGNKFDYRVDKESLDYLDTIIHKSKSTGKEEKIEWKELLLGERSIPNRLHCPIYNGRGS
jgi:hypothetical protein